MLAANAAGAKSRAASRLAGVRVSPTVGSRQRELTVSSVTKRYNFYPISTKVRERLRRAEGWLAPTRSQGARPMQMLAQQPPADDRPMGGLDQTLAQAT